MKSMKGNLMDPQKAERNRKTNRKIVKFLLLPVAAILALLGVLVVAASEPSKGSEGDKIGAGVICEEFLKERISWPSKADFDYKNYKAVEVPSGWIILGKFDSDRRHEFRCEVTHDSAEDQWTLVGLSVDGQDIRG